MTEKQGGFKVQVQQVKTKTSREMLENSHGKDGKQRTLPTFPWHDGGDLYEFIQKLCCTWILNPSRFPAGMTERKAKTEAGLHHIRNHDVRTGNVPTPIFVQTQRRAFRQDAPPGRWPSPSRDENRREDLVFIHPVGGLRLHVSLRLRPRYAESAMPKHEDRSPTIREVASLARVGLMTVSRVINNHPSVRPSTRKKVRAAIAQLGYRQNEAARLLKGQRAMMIGLIVPDLSDAFFASCAHTVQHIARAHGYMTLVVASERDADLEVQQAELMANRKVSGLLVVTSTAQGDDRLRKLQETGLSIVAFDRPLTGIGTDCVLIENRAGAETAVQHLIDHGYRRIACLGYDEDVYTIQERTQGYSNRMLAAGLSPEIVPGLLTLDDVRVWIRKSLKAERQSIAIFSLNHRTSTFLLQALKEMAIKVPEQVALAGFDDFELAPLISPPFTAVAQSPVELATRSMALLLERIRGLRDGKTFTPAKILLPVELHVRASCGPHPKLAPRTLPPPHHR